MTMILKHAAVLSVAIWGLVFWPSSAQADLSGNPPRWSEADVASLSADLVALQRAEFWLQHNRSQEDVRTQLGNARQRQLLGIEEGDLQLLEPALRKWRLVNVVGPAMRIAENPAAPCKLAQILLTKLMAAERQAQLLGMEPTLGADLSNPASLISRAITLAKRRCLEEAYDACMASGDGQYIVSMLGSAVRQFEILSLPDPEFEAQGVYLFRRCTVYQLRYHSASRWDGKNFTFGASYEGSVILLSDVDPSSGFAGLVQEHEWRGPRPSDPDDVIASVGECISRWRNTSAVCDSPQPKFPAQARIKAGDLAMKRSYDEIEVNECDVIAELREGTATPLMCKKPPITRTRKSEGADGLTLTYKPGMVITSATIRWPNGPLPFVPPPSQTTFFTAHLGGGTQATDITLPQWTRVGVQVLFEKPIHGTATVDQGGRLGKSVYADTSKFELAHRPDLFPPEEIVAKWELTATSEAPAPPRAPLSPGAPPR
jgi:hypothetical protein